MDDINSRLYLSKATNGDGYGFKLDYSGTNEGIGLSNDSFFSSDDAEVYPGDYNGDGKTDFFIKGHEKSRALYLAEISGRGEVRFKLKFLNEGIDESGGVDEEEWVTGKDAKMYPGDYDGDGKTDLFVKGSGKVRALYKSVGDDYYKVFQRVFLESNSIGEGEKGGTHGDLFLTSSDAEVYPEDYNGDGRTDLFIKGYGLNRTLYLSKIDFESDEVKFRKVFSEEENIKGGIDSGLYFTSSDANIYPGDYDGNGHGDLFIKGYLTFRALYTANLNYASFGDNSLNKVQKPSAIAENNTILDFSKYLLVYPNPSKGVFSLKIESRINKIEVVSLDGRSIDFKKVAKNTFKLLDQYNGYAIVKVWLETGIKSKIIFFE